MKPISVRSLRWMLLLLLLPCTTGQAQEAPSTGHYLFSYFKGNGEDGLHLAYSTDGYHWRALNRDRPFLTPTAGRDKLMRDPSIVRGPDGTFHMVWTVSWEEKGIGYASSEDLIHWSEQRYLPVMEHQPDARNSWAPELFYDEATEQYLILWATTIPGRFPETDGQDARDDRPGWNHRIYYVTTKDFETFSETRLFYDHGFNVIDAAIVPHGDRYALLLKDETNTPFEPQKNIRLAYSDAAEGPYGPPSEPITGAYWAEGPTALKVGDAWFVYFDKYTEHQFGLLVADDLQDWRDASDRLVVPEGMRHGTAFEVPEAVAMALLQHDQEAHDPDDEAWMQLFNGEDLEGWDVKISGYDLNDNYGNTFRVDNGVLQVAYDQYDDFGSKFGHLFYHEPFSYYVIAVEYRFVGEQAPGGPGWALRNSGVMVHGQSAESMGKDQDFPISIEVQLLGGSGTGERTTANLCTPGTHVEMNGELTTNHCINSTSKTYHGDTWVRSETVVLGDSLIRHIVEGDTVLTYTHPQIGGGTVNGFDPAVKQDGKRLVEGTISLQSESHPVEFRKVELLNLKGCTDPSASNYKSYFVASDPAACRYE